METIIAAVIVVVIVALAAGYIYKAKKNGKKCIGCPDSGSCFGSCSCGAVLPEEQPQKEMLDFGCGCGCCGCDDSDEDECG